MDSIKKLFKKIPKQERVLINNVLKDLHAGDQKIIQSAGMISGKKNWYRIRTGRYRVIFTFSGKNIKIKHIRLRDENTYKNL